MFTSPLGKWIGLVIKGNRVLVGKLEPNPKEPWTISHVKNLDYVSDTKDGIRVTDSGSIWYLKSSTELCIVPGPNDDSFKEERTIFAAGLGKEKFNMLRNIRDTVLSLLDENFIVDEGGNNIELTSA
jgi:hypothetical protein